MITKRPVRLNFPTTLIILPSTALPCTTYFRSPVYRSRCCSMMPPVRMALSASKTLKPSSSISSSACTVDHVPTGANLLAELSQHSFEHCPDMFTSPAAAAKQGTSRQLDAISPPAICASPLDRGSESVVHDSPERSHGPLVPVAGSGNFVRSFPEILSGRELAGSA